MAERQLLREARAREDERRERRRQRADEAATSRHPIYGDATPEQVALGLGRNVATPIRRRPPASAASRGRPSCSYRRLEVEKQRGGASTSAGDPAFPHHVRGHDGRNALRGQCSCSPGFWSRCWRTHLGRGLRPGRGCRCRVGWRACSGGSRGVALQLRRRPDKTYEHAPPGGLDRQVPASWRKRAEAAAARADKTLAEWLGGLSRRGLGSSERTDRRRKAS